MKKYSKLMVILGTSLLLTACGKEDNKPQDEQKQKQEQEQEQKQDKQCPDSRFAGENCDQCAPGFAGENCDQCENDHYAAPDCTQCLDLFKGDNCELCKNEFKTLESGCLKCPNELMSGEECNICNGGYGPECKAYDSVTDQSGIVYKTVIINGQEWMAENYRRPMSGTYNPGDFSDVVSTYGLLYSYEAATKNGFCPEG